jgi:hypothetical protein
MNLYGSDSDVARDLKGLARVADRVADLQRVDQDLSPEARSYLNELDGLTRRYGLDALPGVHFTRDPWGFDFVQPSGKDFVHGWCFKRRTERPLEPEQLGDGAGYAGELPTVAVTIREKWAPTRESRQDFRARVNQAIVAQMEAGLSRLRSEGYRFGGPPVEVRDVHLRWLFERMRHRGRMTYREIAGSARERNEHVPDDIEDAARSVRKAVTALASYLGVCLPSHRGE